ncbi:kelch-like protein 34 [Heterodontus francisci]|uniref:kelch-like protein 34 n=1 Tax=Heterodontus francisci TaxID=7792 RepID=UPI00355B1017
MSIQEHTTSYFLALSPTHGETVLSHYQTLRNDKLLCDIVLVAEGTEFNAHKSLLACASDYFRSMFKDYTRESKASVVYLHMVSATGLQHVLDFIYNSCLALSLETLPQTLETASYLQVLEAVRLCSHYLVSSLSPGSCCQAANVAARFALSEAQRRAEGYIALNLWRLLAAGVEESGLMELNLESLQVVLQSEQVPRLKEAALLSLALEWLSRDQCRWAQADLLLPHIRYGLIPRAELQRLSSDPRGHLLERAGARQLITRALDYHRAESRQPVLQSRQSTLRNPERQLLAVGGVSLQQGASSVLWALNPRTREWSSVSQGPAIQNHCVCVLGNFLFVLGGEELQAGGDPRKEEGLAISNRVHRYDPRFNTWSRVASMLSRRAQFSCCVLDDCIFALGGRCGLQASLAAVEVYDVNSGRWDKVRKLPHKMQGHACAVHNDTIYISGGKYAEQPDASKEMFSFHPLQAEWKRCPPMTIARFGHQMATVGDSIFSFVGMYEPFCDIEYYDPLHKQWQRLRPLLFDRSCYGLAVMDANVYLVGGKKWHNSHEVAAQSAVMYDPNTDTWREVCKLPLPLCGTQCAVLHLPDLPEAEGKLELHN